MLKIGIQERSKNVRGTQIKVLNKYVCQYLETYFLLLGFAKFANKNEIIIIGFFTIHINADAMIPPFTGFTEHPNNSAIWSKAALFT